MHPWIPRGEHLFLLMKALDRVMGLRVRDENESLGLEITQHGEAGYNV